MNEVAQEVALRLTLLVMLVGSIDIGIAFLMGASREAAREHD